ncbi:hypothetical protein ACFYON_00975 [Micromonospora sp. NPDC005686]|uniref:hypothetical protein n=1 Tax=unclassified Micromonospora TaxID=2617518 RepID=UPI0033BBE42B
MSEPEAVTPAAGRPVTPGRPYTFAQLRAARPPATGGPWPGRERQVLRLHLTERAAGAAPLLDTAGRTRT